MVKRVFQLVVLFFAIYAFAFVPLGRMTALEHVRAIAGTDAAHHAASELQGGVKRLVHELRHDAQRSTEASDEETAGNQEPALPSPTIPSPALPSPTERARGSAKARSADVAPPRATR